MVSTDQGLKTWFMPGNLDPVEGHEFILEAGPFGQSPCSGDGSSSAARALFRWGKDWTLTFQPNEQPEGTDFTLITAVGMRIN